MKIALSKQVKIFHPDGGLRPIQRVSLAEAEMLEKLGSVTPVFDSQAGLLGFRACGGMLEKMDSDLKSIRLAAMMTEPQMEMNVGRSQTRGLREAGRLQLIKDGKPPEDAIERVQAKIRVWGRIGSSKGDILRVWPRHWRELVTAE